VNNNNLINLDKICERLRQRMKHLGVNQSRLAKEAGITPSGLSQILNKERTPSTLVLLKLADALNVSVDYLLGRADEISSHDICHQKDIKALIHDYLSVSMGDRKRILDIVSLIRNTAK
jgi:transcriptional regulator with XRE-family HTH domain